MSSRRVRSGRTARSFSCTDEDYEQIRALARRAGQSISEYVVERGLTVSLTEPAEGPARAGPRLVLDEREQREMRLALVGVSRHAKDADWLDELRAEVRAVLHATVLDLIWQGRRDELRALLAQVLGESRALELAERMEVHAQERGWVI